MRPKSSVDLKKTSRKLRNQFIKSGITGAKVADIMGISSKAVYNWLNEKSAPSPKHREQLGAILTANVDELIVYKAGKKK